MASVVASSAPAQGFVSFVNEAVSPYHAVAAAAERLEGAGYVRLSERDVKWDVQPGGKYYVVRNQSAVLAFAVGKKYVPGNGFTIAAAHTDSPCLRVKPISALTKPGGFLSVGVETYGGGLWYSWLDRDLSLAGRVIVRTPSGGFDSRLVRVDRPILRIPSLAIHLNREVNSEGLKLNAENHLAPVLCTAIRAKLEGTEGGVAKDAPGAPAGTGGASTRHHAPLVSLLAQTLGVAPEDVQDFDLCLYDTQPGALGGLFGEFVYAARLDNLMMTWTTLTGLADSTAPPGALDEETHVRIAASFDHEEVGSASTPGAGSTFLEDTLRRLCPEQSFGSGTFPAAIRRSILVSADMAHALHPNYPATHEENHRPVMHGGEREEKRRLRVVSHVSALSVILQIWAERWIMQKRVVPRAG